ncbi:MAG TPA: polysaccharide biosynthesis/export family protein, partial [Acidimicrobiia bacterium]
MTRTSRCAGLPGAGRLLGAWLGLLVLTLPGGLGAQEAGYRVGAKDVLKITVYGQEDLSRSVVVGDDGVLLFPLIGAVAVGGLSPAEVEQRLKTRLGQDYLVDPQVSVAVQEYRSQKVFVLGEVERPGTYALTGRATVLDVLAQAGGPTKTAGRQVV